MTEATFAKLVVKRAIGRTKDAHKSQARSQRMCALRGWLREREVVCVQRSTALKDTLMTLLPGQVKESTEGGGQRESDVQ
eukprot:604393-Amphidinium_carterae.1